MQLLYFTNPLQPIESNQSECAVVTVEDGITPAFLPKIHLYINIKTGGDRETGSRNSEIEIKLPGWNADMCSV